MISISCLMLLIQNIIAYEDLQYQSIVQRFEDLQKNHSDILTLRQNFQNDLDNPIVKCGEEDCQYFYAQITNNSTYNKPAILIVGGFHGNERLGPDIVTELAQYILDNRDSTPIKNYLEDRVILLMPMVNPSGVFYNRREEQQTIRSIDINRDFNYNVKNSNGCFQSKGARALANIYKQYVILTGATFHGGDNCVSWPWGSMNHIKTDSKKAHNPPDEGVFQGLGNLFKSIALDNENLKIQVYKTGYMTDTVYPLNGAYEDWAYASGWEDNQNEKQCSNVPQSFYEGLQGSPKALMYLIEADQYKEPPSNTYGDQETLNLLMDYWPPIQFTQGTIEEKFKNGFGHIPRNILLTLAMIDMTQPYLIEINGEGFQVGGCINVSNIKIISSNRSYLFYDMPGIWSQQQNNHTFQINDTMYYVSLTCDYQFNQSHQPQPNLQPQSYFMQSRLNESFQAIVGDHQLFSRQRFNFVFQNNIFTYLDPQQQINFNKELNEMELLNLNHSHTNPSNTKDKDNNLYKILIGMIIMSIFFSAIFYKYCGREINEEAIEMVRSDKSYEAV